MSQFPGWVYRSGSEPDPRFSLANERTFLAWIRTALALLAGGVGLEALQIPHQAGFRVAAAGVLLILGLLFCRAGLGGVGADGAVLATVAGDPWANSRLDHRGGGAGGGGSGCGGVPVVSSEPFDAGLQPERTLSAWRRTCLAVGVGGLLFIRFAVAERGLAAIVAGLLGLLLAAAAYVDAARRYRRMYHHLTGGRDLPSAAVPITLAAASVLVFAVTCGIWLVVTAT
jgi:putative membrane protein